jgi:hypothetical protein
MTAPRKPSCFLPQATRPAIEKRSPIQQLLPALIRWSMPLMATPREARQSYGSQPAYRRISPDAQVVRSSHPPAVMTAAAIPAAGRRWPCHNGLAGGRPAAFRQLPSAGMVLAHVRPASIDEATGVVAE